MQDQTPAFQSTQNHRPAYTQDPRRLGEAAFADGESVPSRSSPPLSPTERRVYDLLLRRMTERQVAEEIGRSHNTVHVHVRNIYRKLGVRSRQQLLELPYQAARAVRRQG